MKQVKLPNGERIFTVDKFTALYVYNEIYVDRVYLKHGLAVKDGDIVFDIGGNIGVFTRFITSQASNLKIFTFEPIPAIYEVLERNISNFNSQIFSYNFGLGDKEQEIDFNYYPRCSGDSAAVAFDWDYKVEKYVEHYKDAICQDMPIAKIVPKFLRKRVVEAGLKRIYKPEKVKATIRKLSDIIRENNIDRINFMKIDAENYEMPVLKGIQKQDWNKIEQIAMEVHTHIKGGGNLFQEITELLEGKGFKTFEGEESRETIMGVYMLYAKK